MTELVLHSTPTAELKSFIATTIKAELQAYNKERFEEEQRNRLYTRTEVSKMLGITLKTLDQYSKENVLPRIMIGKNIRYKQSDIDTLLAKGMSNIKYQRR